MPSTSNTKPAAAQEEITEQLGRMAAFNGEAIEAFAQACQAYASGVATLNGELMGFVNARLNHDAELAQALCQCANWSDAVDVQQQWAQQATQEYLSETDRLTELASKVAKESWGPVYERNSQIMTDPDQPVR